MWIFVYEIYWEPKHICLSKWKTLYVASIHLFLALFLSFPLSYARFPAYWKLLYSESNHRTLNNVHQHGQEFSLNEYEKMCDQKFFARALHKLGYLEEWFDALRNGLKIRKLEALLNRSTMRPSHRPQNQYQLFLIELCTFSYSIYLQKKWKFFWEKMHLSIYYFNVPSKYTEIICNL